MEDFLREMLEQIFTSSDTINNIHSILTTDLVGNGIWPTITSIYDSAIKPIGVALITLYFWMELIEKATSERFNIETVIRLLVKMIIAFVLIQYGLDIFATVVRFGNAVIDDLWAITSDPSDSLSITADINAYVDELGWIDVLVQTVMYLLPYAASYIVSIIIIIQCWSRNINLLVRIVMAPIALADMYNDGPRAQGFMYIRKTIAVALQGAIMVAIAFCAAYFSAVAFASDGGGTLTFDEVGLGDAIMLVGMQFMVVGLIQTAGPIANALCGDH